MASFPLSLVSEGETVRIVQVPQGIKARERLLSLGLNQNDTIQVIQKNPGGAVLIDKQGFRYALGGGMAHTIHVVRCEEP